MLDRLVRSSKTVDEILLAGRRVLKLVCNLGSLFAPWTFLEWRRECIRELQTLTEHLYYPLTVCIQRMIR